MKFFTACATAALLIGGITLANAQSQPAGAQDKGANAKTENAVPAQDKNGAAMKPNAMKPAATTSGSAVPSKETMEKNKSPAAPNAGIKQEK